MLLFDANINAMTLAGHVKRLNPESTERGAYVWRDPRSGGGEKFYNLREALEAADWDFVTGCGW